MKNIKRKISTILAADCVAFSSFMDKDLEAVQKVYKLNPIASGKTNKDYRLAFFITR